MSAQTAQIKKADIDLNMMQVMRTSLAYMRMIRTMEKALRSIATSEVSQHGSLKQKQIAEKALLEVYEINENMGGK
jgi:hypothetical protein